MAPIMAQTLGEWLSVEIQASVNRDLGFLHRECENALG